MIPRIFGTNRISVAYYIIIISFIDKIPIIKNEKTRLCMFQTYAIKKCYQIVEI